MLAQINSLSLDGLSACPVTVEVSISPGLPAMHIGGLADTAILEARERVRAAIKESGMTFPMSRITCNLTPAHVRKEGSHLDLPIALGILSAHGEIPTLPQDVICVGELSLSGVILPVRGILTMALAAARSNRFLLCPADQVSELNIFSGFKIIPCRTLSDVVEWMKTQSLIDHAIVTQSVATKQGSSNTLVRLEDIKGLEYAKAALILAVAGRHHLLMVGTPGIGKTLLGQAARSLQIEMTPDERIEVAALHSLRKGVFTSEGTPSYPSLPPFRSPHHSASSIAIVGGGNPIRPGEISLSHHGILFLDEFPEFERDVIEALRQPMQDGKIAIARSSGSEEYPARTTVIAAMNPCRCGFHGSSTRSCTCQPSSIRAYRQRISGPIVDRFDLVINMSEPIALSEIWTQRFGSFSTERGRSLVCNVRDALRRSVTCLAIPGAEALVDRYRERGWITRRSAKSLLSIAHTLAIIADSPTIDEEIVQAAYLFKVAQSSIDVTA